MSTANYFIIGAGGHARVIAETVHLLGRSCNGVIDLDFKGQKESILDYEVVGGLDVLEEYNPATTMVFVAIGDNEKRKGVLINLQAKGFQIDTLIHPSALVSPTAQVGLGSWVGARAILSTQAEIGKGCIINSAAIVEHESQIADYVHLAPGVKIAGRVHIGAGSFVGIGAVIIDRLEIGHGVTVGAGAVITENITDGKTVVGVNKVL